MLCEPATVRRALGDGNPRAHGDRFPAELSNDHRREPPVAIDRPDQPLDVDDLRLQLHDQQGLGRRVPREEIDHPAFAPHRERSFRHNDPSRFGEHAHDDLVHRRMAGVQQAIEVRAAPAEEDVDVGPQSRGDGDELLHAHSPEVAALDACNDRPWHARAGGGYPLSQVRPNADRPNASPDARTVHGRHGIGVRSSWAYLGECRGGRTAPGVGALRRDAGPRP